MGFCTLTSKNFSVPTYPRTHTHTHTHINSKIVFFLKKDFIYLFLERGEGRETERERNMTVEEKYQSVASWTHLTGNWTHNPGMYPDWQLNWRPFPLQDAAQPTEPHWLGLTQLFLYSCSLQQTVGGLRWRLGTAAGSVHCGCSTSVCSGRTHDGAPEGLPAGGGNHSGPSGRYSSRRWWNATCGLTSAHIIHYELGRHGPYGYKNLTTF